MSVNNSSTEAITPRVSLFQGIRPFDRSKLMPEILAGIALAALGIPEVMGYTKIIGTPVITGLYTLLLPVLAFAVFGSSRHLVVAADSATAAMVSAALASYVGGPQYVALTSLVALVAGGLLLLARGLRLGFLADFLSRTVLIGFLTGVGFQVAFAELQGVLGLEDGGEGFWGHLFFTAKHLIDIDPATVCIACCVLGMIVVFERFAPRFPGALLAVVGMIAASAMFHWGDHGMKLVGDVPNGLPSLGLPNVAWNDVPLVLPIAFSCCIVILAQSAATSRAYAFRYGEQISEDTDLVGLSFANLAAGLSGTFVVNGSPTKTAMVDSAGGRSQIAHLTTAATVLLVLLFLTKPLSYLPNAVLAAIVFMIGVKLIKLRELAEIRKKSLERVCRCTCYRGNRAFHRCQGGNYGSDRAVAAGPCAARLSATYGDHPQRSRGTLAYGACRFGANDRAGPRDVLVSAPSFITRMRAISPSKSCIWLSIHRHPYDGSL